MSDVPRPITLLHSGEEDHVFEVPRRDPKGAVLREGDRIDRSSGRPVKVLGNVIVDRYRIPPRDDFGAPSRLTLSEAEFASLIGDPSAGPIVRQLITGERPTVHLIGAVLPELARAA